MKAFTFCTFIWNNKVIFITNGLLSLISIYLVSIGQNYISVKRSAITITPIIGAFINCCVWTFWFTCTAIYTLICNYNSHVFLFLVLIFFFCKNTYTYLLNIGEPQKTSF